MKENNFEFDFFRDAMKIFIAYIKRQFKKNPNYKPHPLIRAFECALSGIENIECGERAFGISKDGKNEKVYNPYIVVLEKKEKGIEVKEIRNLLINKTLPVDIMIILFRLQIIFDKIEGDTLNPQQVGDALNAVIPGNRFYVLGDKWKEARDEFKKLLEEGKIHLPDDPELKRELSNINWYLPWEEYSNRLRSIIGSAAVPALDKEGGKVIITSLEDSKIEKGEVFNIATEFMLGKTAVDFKPFKKNK